jgi:hypothetical protein
LIDRKSNISVGVGGPDDGIEATNKKREELIIDGARVFSFFLP